MAECLLVLDTHPNAQARLHDPFDLRRFRPLSCAFDFSRLNRWMHDRSFTVDGRVSIPGRRKDLLVTRLTHAMTSAVDGARIFVGSFNFDPRSTLLNTEMGLLIESERLAREMHAAFDRNLDSLARRVEARDGRLVWIDPADSDAPVQIHEPGSNLFRRIALSVIGWLPVEWLL